MNTVEIRSGAKPKRIVRSHGLSYTPEYRAWQTMRLRCTVPTNPAYKDYGGRGIKVCARWLESPAAFVADMGPKPSPAHELDRYPNNDGDYEPGNCRWALRKDNCRNRRSSRVIECDGEALTLIEWAERSGVRAETIAERLDRGWDQRAAIFTAARFKAQKGQGFKSIGNCCTECGGKTFGIRCRKCENRRRPRDTKGRMAG